MLILSTYVDFILQLLKDANFNYLYRFRITAVKKYINVL